MKCASRNPAHFLGSWAFPSPTKRPQYPVPCWAKAHLLAEKKLKAVEHGHRFARVHQTPSLMGPFKSKTNSFSDLKIIPDIYRIPDISVLLGT